MKVAPASEVVDGISTRNKRVTRGKGWVVQRSLQSEFLDIWGMASREQGQVGKWEGERVVEDVLHVNAEVFDVYIYLRVLNIDRVYECRHHRVSELRFVEQNCQLLKVVDSVTK